MPSATPAAQDYLKQLCLAELEAAGPPGAISTTEVAGRMGVSAASATNMLKRLAGMGLVRHTRYRGTELTAAGRKIGLEVVRHHRLLETYLAEALGVPWDKVHAEAEVLEHVLSEDLEDRIASLLGHPTADPHGHPIPAKDGSMPEASRRRLWETPDGESVAVQSVSDAHEEALRYLASVGITPGSEIEVVGRGPLEGPLFLKVAGGTGEVEAVSKRVAEAVWVA